MDKQNLLLRNVVIQLGKGTKRLGCNYKMTSDLINKGQKVKYLGVIFQTDVPNLPLNWGLLN